MQFFWGGALISCSNGSSSSDEDDDESSYGTKIYSESVTFSETPTQIVSAEMLADLSIKSLKIKVINVNYSGAMSGGLLPFLEAMPGAMKQNLNGSQEKVQTRFTLQQSQTQQQSPHTKQTASILQEQTAQQPAFQYSMLKAKQKSQMILEAETILHLTEIQKNLL